MVNWWWKLLLLLNNYGSLVNYWVFDKMMFWSWVLSIIWYVFMHMTYKHYLGRNLSVERSKLECLGKRVLKFKVFFFWTHECSLKRALSEAQASVLRSLLDTVRLSELWANKNVAFGLSSLEQTVSELQAKTPRMLLRPGRLSEPDFASANNTLYSHTWFFVSCTWGPIRTF